MTRAVQFVGHVYSRCKVAVKRSLLGHLAHLSRTRFDSFHYGEKIRSIEKDARPIVHTERTHERLLQSMNKKRPINGCGGGALMDHTLITTHTHTTSHTHTTGGLGSESFTFNLWTINQWNFGARTVAGFA